MKKVYCTIGGSMNNVCHINMTRVLFPDNWKGNTRQDECASIADIENFIKETGAELVMFGIRSNGIPNKAVKVIETEKISKAFKRLEKINF